MAFIRASGDLRVDRRGLLTICWTAGVKVSIEYASSLTVETTCGTFVPAGAGALVVTVVGAVVTEGDVEPLEVFVVLVPAVVPGAKVVVTLGRIACSHEVRILSECLAQHKVARANCRG